LSAELSTEQVPRAQTAAPYLQRLAFKVGDRSIVLKPPSEIVQVETEDWPDRPKTLHRCGDAPST
jgi:hypothetical protein